MWLAWKKNKQRTRAAPHREELALWGLLQRRVDTAAWASLSSCPSGDAWRTMAQAPTLEELRLATGRKGPTRGAGSYALDGAAPDRLPQDTLAVNLSLVWKPIHARETSHTSTKTLRTPDRNSAAPDQPASRQGRRRARRDVRLRASSLLWTPQRKTSSRSNWKLAQPEKPHLRCAPQSNPLRNHIFTLSVNKRKINAIHQ